MESSNIDTDILYVKVYIIHIDIYSDIMTWLSSGGKANWFLCRTSISMRPTLELFWWKRGNMPLYKNEKSHIQSTVNIAFTILVLLYLALGLHYGTKRCSEEEMIKPIFFPPLLSGHFNVNLDIEINRQLTTEAWRIYRTAVSSSLTWIHRGRPAPRSRWRGRSRTARCSTSRRWRSTDPGRDADLQQENSF